MIYLKIKINAVYIACTPDKHFEYIIKSSNYKKDILCEKPLVLSLNQLSKVTKTPVKKIKRYLLLLFIEGIKKIFIHKKIIKKRL